MRCPPCTALPTAALPAACRYPWMVSLRYNDEFGEHFCGENDAGAARHCNRHTCRPVPQTCAPRLLPVGRGRPRWRCNQVAQLFGRRGCAAPTRACGGAPACPCRRLPDQSQLCAHGCAVSTAAGQPVPTSCASCLGALLLHTASPPALRVSIAAACWRSPRCPRLPRFPSALQLPA